jgi:hypothetical protein
VWPAADIGAQARPVNAKSRQKTAEHRRALKRFIKTQEDSGIPMASSPGPAHEIPEPSLNLPLDKLGYIILKAREYDVKEEDADPDSGSNPIDDGQTDVLTNTQDDPVREELLGAIRGLGEDERMRLIALAWLGRGTYSKEEWREAVATARSEHSRRAAEYLLGLPLLGDYLEEGLAMFDEGIVDSADKTEGVDAENEPLGNMRDKPARQ